MFQAGSGLIARQAAAEAIATKLGAPKENVQIMSLKGKFGSRDLVGEALVFTDSNAARIQLPSFRSIRMLSKDERKKVKEELKKAKSPAPKSAEKTS